MSDEVWWFLITMVVLCLFGAGGYCEHMDAQSKGAREKCAQSCGDRGIQQFDISPWGDGSFTCICRDK